MVNRYFLAFASCSFTEKHNIIGALATAFIAFATLLLTIIINYQQNQIGLQQNEIAKQVYVMQKFELLQKSNEYNKKVIEESSRFFQLSTMTENIIQDCKNGK